MNKLFLTGLVLLMISASVFAFSGSGGTMDANLLHESEIGSYASGGTMDLNFVSGDLPSGEMTGGTIGGRMGVFFVAVPVESTRRGDGDDGITCASYDGSDICTADEICPGSWKSADDTDRCCSTMCVEAPPADPCEGIICDDNDDCTTDSCEEGKCVYTLIEGCREDEQDQDDDDQGEDEDDQGEDEDKQVPVTGGHTATADKDFDPNAYQVNYSENVGLGDNQEFRIHEKETGTGTISRIVIISPSGAVSEFETDLEGLGEYLVAETGMFSVKVFKDGELVKGFRFFGQATSTAMFGIFTAPLTQLLGAEVMREPYQVILLILIGLVAGIIVYLKGKHAFFDKKTMSSREENIQNILVVGLSLAAIIVPFLGARIGGIALLGTAAGIVEIAVVLGLDYYRTRIGRKISKVKV